MNYLETVAAVSQLFASVHDNYTIYVPRFYVEARDQGSPSLSAVATAAITVLDRNDNDPRLSRKVYDIVVSESAPLGSEVLKVVATDPDENSEVRYEIMGGNAGSAFSISSHQVSSTLFVF